MMMRMMRGGRRKEEGGRRKEEGGMMKEEEEEEEEEKRKRKRKRKRMRKRKRKRRQRERERHANTCALSQTTPVPRCKQALLRRLQVPAPTKNLLNGQTLWSADQKKKTRARELSITGGARNGRLWRARTPSICE